MSKEVLEKAKIAVVGGGIAGSTIALYLSELGLNVTLFEKGPSLVNGPPICHLHAGGNLYREISDKQCVTLLKESIDLVRFYPKAVDYRPTVITVPIEDSGSPQDLYARLNMLRAEYAAMIEEDPGNKVLGESSEYFKLYDKEQIAALKKLEVSGTPKSPDEWMIPVVKNIDLNRVQFPLIMVQEYGLNVFRLASTATLILEKKENCKVLLKHEVTALDKGEERCLVTYKHNGETKEERFDFLINAAGFRTGTLDDMLGFKRERFVEFKAAYVTQCDTSDIWPEVVFLGERGTPKGMAQFTPYPSGFFQLHGMTKSITLFEEGLVKSSTRSAYPKLKTKFMDKIEKAWKPADVKKRSQLAIDHLAYYIPAFTKANIVSKPLYGAQQIPGDDDTLRAADVSFENAHYARCEIVKASSVLSMADAITKQLIDLGYVDKSLHGKRDFDTMRELDETEITKQAESLCSDRDYPLALAHRTMTDCQV